MPVIHAFCNQHPVCHLYSRREGIYGMVHRVMCVGPRPWLRSTFIVGLSRCQRVEIVSRRTFEEFRPAHVPSGPAIAIVAAYAREPFQAFIPNLARHTLLRCLAVVKGEGCDHDLARLCVEADFWGVVLPGASECASAIARVAAGRLSYPTAILDRIVTREGRMTLADDRPTAQSLDAMEVQLIELLASGATIPQAATRLDIQQKRVATTYLALRKKFGASNRIALVRSAIREGIILP